jgi:D-sedoheptulose 7-phosphate isomerase
MSDIQNIIKSSIDVKEKLWQNVELCQSIDLAIQMMTRAFRDGRRVYFCGNGGSAADAQHIAAELSGRFYKDRPALPAEALHVNSSYLTAVANDYSFDKVYARYVEGILNEGDVLVLFSTSGNSPNIVEAAKMALSKNINTIALTGHTGGLLRQWATILINVPSDVTPRIQEAHILIGHILCEFVEKNLFNDNISPQ